MSSTTSSGVATAQDGSLLRFYNRWLSKPRITPGQTFMDVKKAPRSAQMDCTASGTSKSGLKPCRLMRRTRLLLALYPSQT